MNVPYLRFICNSGHIGCCLGDAVGVLKADGNITTQGLIREGEEGPRILKALMSGASGESVSQTS